MDLVFAHLAGETESLPGPGMLVVRGAGVHQERRDLALLALEEGETAFLRGDGPIQKLILKPNPTLDEMLAAEILRRRLEGKPVPAGIKAFAHHAAVCREGLASREVPLDRSLHGIFLALCNLPLDQAGAEDLLHPGAAARFLAGWATLAGYIWRGAEAGQDPSRGTFVVDGPELARERAFLAEDEKVYRQDVRAGERWLVRLPGLDHDASGLLLRRPRSILWKYWSRCDAGAPVGGAYLFLAVYERERHWRFSTDPVHRLGIAGLAEQLQDAEMKKARERAARDPWFDGKPYGHTLVAAPQEGTLLSDAEVLRLVKRWARARRPASGSVPLSRGTLAAGVLSVVAILLALYLPSWWKQPTETTPEQPAPVTAPAEVEGVRAVVDGQAVTRGLTLDEGQGPILSVSLQRVELRRGDTTVGFKVDRHVTMPVRMWVTLTATSDTPLQVDRVSLEVNGENGVECRARDRASPHRITFGEHRATFEAPENRVDWGRGARKRSEARYNTVFVRIDNPAAPTEARITLSWKADVDPSRKWKLYLLPIGVSSYPHYPQLANAQRDAEEWLRAFREEPALTAIFDLRLDPALEGKAMTNQQVTRAEVFQRLEWIRNEVRKDSRGRSLVLITLSGHGVRGLGEHFFFVPWDARPKEEPLEVRHLPWGDIERYLKEMPCPVIVVMDTCHSGTVEVSGFRGEATPVELQKAVQSAMQGLEQARKGLVYIAACLADEVAREHDRWGHGALTLALVEGLTGKHLYRSEGGDTELPGPDGDGVLYLEQVCDYARKRVKELVEEATAGRGAAGRYSPQAVGWSSTKGLHPGRLPIAVRVPVASKAP